MDENMADSYFPGLLNQLREVPPSAPQAIGLLSDLGNYISPSNQSWAPWPIMAVRHGLSALAAPGDAYSGTLPMMDASGHTSLAAIGRATDLAGLLTLGAGAAPAESGAVLNAGLRDRYAPYLREASGGKDPARIKLTPERIEVAKELYRTGLGFFPEGRPNPPIGSNPGTYRQTPQAQAAADYATQARRAGIDDVRVKFADGPSGSVYVRTGDRGTVRFADHAPPEGYFTNPKTGKEEFGVVGGYSSELGRRHYPAAVNVSPARRGAPLNTQPAYDFLAAILRGDGT